MRVFFKCVSISISFACCRLATWKNSFSFHFPHHISLDFVLSLGLSRICSAICMYLLLERGHKGSSILSSLFCVLGWPGLPLWWPQDVALVSCCVFCFRFCFFFFYLTKVFLTFYFLRFLFFVARVWNLQLVYLRSLCQLCVAAKVLFFLCCCLTLCCCCCCCCDKPKGAKRHEGDDDDDVLISLLAFHSMTPRCVCSSLIYLYAEVRLAEKRKKMTRKENDKKKLSKEIWLGLGFLFLKPCQVN